MWHADLTPRAHVNKCRHNNGDHVKPSSWGASKFIFCLLGVKWKRSVTMGTETIHSRRRSISSFPCTVVFFLCTGTPWGSITFLCARANSHRVSMEQRKNKTTLSLDPARIFPLPLPWPIRARSWNCYLTHWPERVFERVTPSHSLALPKVKSRLANGYGHDRSCGLKNVTGHKNMTLVMTG